MLKPTPFETGCSVAFSVVLIAWLIYSVRLIYREVGWKWMVGIVVALGAFFYFLLVTGGLGET